MNPFASRKGGNAGESIAVSIAGEQKFVSNYVPSQLRKRCLYMARPREAHAQRNLRKPVERQARALATFLLFPPSK